MSFCMELEDHLIPPAEWKDRYEEMTPNVPSELDTKKAKGGSS